MLFPVICAVVLALLYLRPAHKLSQLVTLAAVLGTVAVLCWGIDKPQHLTNVIHWWWAHAQVCSAHSRGDACICACAGISACVSRVSKLTMRGVPVSFRTVGHRQVVAMSWACFTAPLGLSPPFCFLMFFAIRCCADDYVLIIHGAFNHTRGAPPLVARPSRGLRSIGMVLRLCESAVIDSSSDPFDALPLGRVRPTRHLPDLRIGPAALRRRKACEYSTELCTEGIPSMPTDGRRMAVIECSTRGCCGCRLRRACR